MGNPNTRKSSIIRALTGFLYQNPNNTRRYEVQTTNNVLHMYIEPSSLQEKNILPNAFINMCNNENHILVALWIKDRTLRNRERTYYPRGVDYIQHFINAGWNIRQVVVLGVGAIPNMPNLPVNTGFFFIQNPLTIF